MRKTHGEEVAIAETVVGVRVRPATAGLSIAFTVTLFSVVRRVDHIVRSNRSGWPFEEGATPVWGALALVVLYGLLLTSITLVVTAFLADRARP